MGGVINIVTRNEKKEALLASCSEGSYQLRTCSATFNHHLAALFFNATLLAKHTDNYRDHNDYDQQLLTGNVAYFYPSGLFNFKYKLANEAIQYPGALTASQIRQNRRQSSNDIDFFSDWSGLFHLRQEQHLQKNWQLNTDLVRRDMHGHGVLSSPFTQSRIVYLIKPTLKGILGQLFVTSGIDLEEDHYRLNSPFGTTDNTQQKYGVFALTNFPLAPRWTASLGARGAEQNSHLVTFAENNAINRVLATTVGFSYQWNPNLALYLRRAGNFRFPKADENALVPAGVTSLKTQRGLSYETGLELITEKYSSRFSLYQLDLRDEIAFDPTQTPQQPFGTNQNLSPTERHGLTVSGENQLTDQLALGGQYNYVNARFQSGINSGNRIPLVSDNIFRANVNYKITAFWNVYSEAIFTGNQFPANDDANVAGKIGGYTIYNMNLRYHQKNLEASFRVNNIFNKFYYFYTTYEPTQPLESFYPAPGRNFSLTVTASFV